VRRPLVLALVLVLAGCGGSGGAARGHGTAALWVTRDRGAHVVFAGNVPAGLNAVQTVERKLKLTTRYGGRYVQSIDGVEGSLASQRDWFYFVDGIEGDRSAVEVKVKPGAVLWWDYRHWTPATEHVPAVAGAWPHPFVDAPTSVVSADRALARKLALQVHGVVNAKTTRRDFVLVGPTYAPDHVRIYPFRRGYVLELGTRIARRLAADPHALRYRF
jgi:hypothetical protein